MNREPTKEQLDAMAYADGELEGPARREFEDLMATRPDLAREVTRLKRLEILARQAAGPEPMDSEWARLDASPLHRGGLGLGLGFLLLGASGLCLWFGFELLRSDLPPWSKACLGSLFAGALLLLCVTVRARLRTLPFDPYTEIKR